MPQLITVDDLISDVRSLCDEHDTLSVGDESDILPALNRGQRYAADILAKQYEPVMLRHVVVQPIGGQIEYPIPVDCYEERLEKVEVQINGLYYPVSRLSYRDATDYETTGRTSTPDYYVISGRNFRLLPKPSGAYALRIWYLTDPMKLVKSQGCITVVDTATMSVIVDSVGSDLTTQIDSLGSFVNVIDGQTGLRKATLQIKNISGNQVKFKTSPSRSTVQTIPVDTSMTTLLVNPTSDTNNEGAAVSIQPDDYICAVNGSCVPFFKNPISNFLVQYAVAEIRRKLGGNSDAEQAILNGLETQVARSWVGRESSLKVHRSSNKWGSGRRSAVSRG